MKHSSRVLRGQVPGPYRWLLVCLMLCSGVCAAHDSRPLFVAVSDDGEAIFTLRWTTPDSIPPDNAPDVRLADPCVPRRSDRAGPATMALRGVTLYQCADADAAVTLEIRYPGDAPSLSTLVRRTAASGEVSTLHAGPGEFDIQLTGRPQTASVIRQYSALGLEHILSGYDHLLFVAALVLLAGTWQRIVVAVTGFTLAHSLTLAGAALGFLRLPIPPVEAAIALSILFLARELARDRRDTLTWRYPIAVSASFGLLHGLGFASVLGDIGLPQGEILPALFSFNLGVEAGQLGFVAVLLALLRLSGGLVPGRDQHDEAPTAVAFSSGQIIRFAAYPIGILSAFWFVERLAGFPSA